MPGREDALYKLIELKDIIGTEGLDLLWNLLDLDPQTRITIDDALKHPFFLDSHIDMEIDSKPKKYNEEILLPDPFYMAKQSMITESMRTILVDWLVDVSIHFEVKNETLHYAISYIDRTLSLLEIEKNKLQLVGVTCMKIADVFNEKSKEYYRQENASEYAYITADEYTAEEVIDMEKKILTLLDFNCFSSIVPHYLNKVKTPEEINILSNYLADIILLTTKTLKYKPSLLASSILFLSFDVFSNFKGSFFKNAPNNDFIDLGEPLFGCYSLLELSECIKTVKRCWADIKTSTSSKHDAVNTKYETQDLVNLKDVKIPDINSAKIERWYYTSKSIELSESTK